MTITKLHPTFTFDQDRLDALRAIAPEAFADGKVNWDALREALGDRVEDEGRDAEHFGLFWPGKRDARRLASQPSAGTLRPAPSEGVNEATTRHVFIEGDNLEVLKLLQKCYAGRVKMIYIDPPYNTGNDFIYSDNFTQPLEEYLRATGQADGMGRVLVTNTKADGRYHSSWLSMMYPRLRLARSLLRDDGVILVSIDDNEVHNLRQIMHEVFGEENFITMFTWEKTQHFGRQKLNVYSNADYVLAFAKNLQNAAGLRARRLVERIVEDLEDAPLYNASNRTTEITFPAGGVKFNIPDGIYDHSTDLKYQLLTSVHVEDGVNANEFTLRFRSRWSQSTVIEEWSKGATYWVKSQNFAIRVIYQDDKTSLSSPRQMLFSNAGNPLVTCSRFGQKVGTSEEGTSELNTLLGVEFEEMYPKPESLIEYLLSLVFDEEEQKLAADGIVLDFFAGTCTTAQAVLHLNRIDSGTRQFIMIQLPETTPPDSEARRAGYATIADVGKERIRRVIQRMQAEDAGKLITGRDREAPEDLGFRVFKLDRSNYKAWSDFEGGDVAELQTLFDRFQSPLVEGWKSEDVLVEVMLMEGFPLDSTTEALPEFTHNTITRVSSDLVAHRLFVCLDEGVHDETIAALALGEDDIFICLDAALTDEAKVRLEDGRRVKVI